MKYSNMPWLILFGGAGREGVVKELSSAGINIVKILVPKCRSDKLANSIKLLKSLSDKVLPIEKGELGTALKNHENAVLLSIGFPYIIPEELFSRHPLALNMHPTLLPKYRGPTSGAYILINNEKFSGSTVHLLESEVDTGPVVAQSKVALSPFDTLRSMQRRVYESEPALLLEAVQKLDAGFIPVPQDESSASSFPSLRKPEDSIIDPFRPLIDLVNEIRACDPQDYPAFFMYHGEKVCVKIWRPEKKQNESDML